MEWYWWVLIIVAAVVIGALKLKVLGLILERRKKQELEIPEEE